MSDYMTLSQQGQEHVLKLGKEKWQKLMKENIVLFQSLCSIQHKFFP